ncbi:universal stress protein [Seonamhaeicola marinus]|uniref:Universal stress protein n=1 Tax=Seonamhaeicola marinus TaxID=1912246 RepID=A0A5D0HKV1_9FLAO|nr:universal stress protein [Seonamhaeicola marinus]TYA71600.1 universal stress protein [Seonamhaeicola marinus]
MRAILLPTDFSKNSLNAINYAVELFKEVDCQFYVLNVQKASAFISDDMMVVSSTTTIYNTLIDAAKKSIANVISNIKTKHNNKKHSFHSIVDYDNFMDSINQMVKKYNIDLIVMGTKGASGLSRILFGSNTVRVMRNCDTPLLAIPSECEFNALKEIGFVTNHITLYDKETLKALKDLVTISTADLTILHLTNDTNSEEYIHNHTFFDLYFNKVSHRSIETEREGILNSIKTKEEYDNIGMLSIVKKHHSFLEYLLKNFTEEEIAYSCQLPLLILNKETL